MTTEPTLQTSGTEGRHPEHTDLDRLATPALLAAFVGDQQRAALAVQLALPALAALVDAALPRLQRGGRLVHGGAGTSGRLGVLDSVELGPTFSWPTERAPALLAGGRRAMFRAVEGAEDDAGRGAADIAALQVGADDVVLGITASGRTPYVLGLLQAAQAAGALAAALVNNPQTPAAAMADMTVLLDTGPEVITGSTRLKAGTAQKIALNTISSALMVRLHKVHGNLMVDLRASNRKLVARALALTVQASGADAAAARAALDACGWRVKVAIVMLRAGLVASEAEYRLDAAQGSVDAALA